MRVLAIGDIHGCKRALDALLDAIDPQPDDLLITLGDYVDRGPNSRGVIERLLALRETHRLIALKGNHDQMMLNARHDGRAVHDWLCYGGGTTLESYAHDTFCGGLEDVPQRHWDFLEKGCCLFHEIDSHFFVHANAFPNVPLAEQPQYMLMWEKLDDPQPHESGKIMVCGHTAQKSGLPLNLGHTICIDTFVYGDGWLTCLDVKSGQIWQANQQGQRRTCG